MWYNDLWNMRTQVDELMPRDALSAKQGLLRKAAERGFVTYEDILNAFPKAEENLAEVEGILTELMESGIEVAAPADGPNHGKDRGNGTDGRAEDAAQEGELERKFDSVAVDDAVGLYFQEVGGVPLLSAEQEVTLAKRIEAGRAASEALAQEGLDLEARLELSEIVEDGLAAREHLICANARLVISVANKYVGRGVPFLDLIQEGSIGLIRTADKYDYRRGNRFSTYATWWIRQAVSRAVADQSRTIRLPVHKGDQISRLRRTSHQLAQKTGREPTSEELASALGIPQRKVEFLQSIGRPLLSLAMPTDDEGDSELADFVEDVEGQGPEEEVVFRLLREMLDGLLLDLSPREVRILQLRYGLIDGVTHTLEQVGRKLGVSRERVRQIEAKALGRLRHPARLRRLKGFLN